MKPTVGGPAPAPGKADDRDRVGLPRSELPEAFLSGRQWDFDRLDPLVSPDHCPAGPCGELADWHAPDRRRDRSGLQWHRPPQEAGSCRPRARRWRDSPRSWPGCGSARNRTVRLTHREPAGRGPAPSSLVRAEPAPRSRRARPRAALQVGHRATSKCPPTELASGPLGSEQAGPCLRPVGRPSSRAPADRPWSRQSPTRSRGSSSAPRQTTGPSCR